MSTKQSIATTLLCSLLALMPAAAQQPVSLCLFALAKGTPVATPTGTKAIEQIAVGDEVLSYNPLTKQIEVARVTETAMQHQHFMCEYRIGETVLKASDDLPLCSPNGYRAVKPAEQCLHLKAELLKEKQKLIVLDEAKRKAKKKKLNGLKPYNTCEDAYIIKSLDRNGHFFAAGFCIPVSNPVK